MNTTSCGWNNFSISLESKVSSFISEKLSEVEARKGDYAETGIREARLQG
jgi:hypothetical protein